MAGGISDKTNHVMGPETISTGVARAGDDNGQQIHGINQILTGIGMMADGVAHQKNHAIRLPPYYPHQQLSIIINKLSINNQELLIIVNNGLIHGGLGLIPGRPGLIPRGPELISWGSGDFLAQYLLPQGV